MLVGGLWLAGVVHAYGDAWLDAAIALFIVVVRPRRNRRDSGPKQARLLATKLAAEGGDTAELRRLLDDRATLAINYVSALLVVAMLVLMIWRPGE